MSKGFILSIEATISILLLGLALATMFQHQSFSFKEITVLQQENDLLKIWGIKFPSDSEMIFDAKKMFGENFDIFVDGKQIFASKELHKNCVSSEATILDDSLKEKNFLIKVYFE
ncbi:MAG: hypothetical protein NTZ73_04090 [Candidatus Diapherotrites archaeon]|nr:hypothetical protein [Candidatus Diapherotrites archaeon]